MSAFMKSSEYLQFALVLARLDEDIDEENFNNFMIELSDWPNSKHISGKIYRNVFEKLTCLSVSILKIINTQNINIHKLFANQFDVIDSDFLVSNLNIVPFPILLKLFNSLLTIFHFMFVELSYQTELKEKKYSSMLNFFPDIKKILYNEADKIEINFSTKDGKADLFRHITLFMEQATRRSVVYGVILNGSKIIQILKPANISQDEWNVFDISYLESNLLGRTDLSDQEWYKLTDDIINLINQAASRAIVLSYNLDNFRI